MNAPPPRTALPLGLKAFLAVAVVGLVASGMAPHERLTWWLEVAPVLVAAPILVATAGRFPLTPLAYALVTAHAIVLMVGGRYTYARVPAGFWLQDLLALDRNPYDRLGHLAQGFVPAIVVRELLVRHTALRGRWLPCVVVCVCLAISASYELLEWASAVALGQGAEAFLGTQGDPWDTQADMACALVGSIASLVLLSRIHDRQLARYAHASA